MASYITVSVSAMSPAPHGTASRVKDAIDQIHGGGGEQESRRRGPFEVEPAEIGLRQHHLSRERQVEIAVVSPWCRALSLSSGQVPYKRECQYLLNCPM